jgi:hypothetical protein
LIRALPLRDALRPSGSIKGDLAPNLHKALEGFIRSCKGAYKALKGLNTALHGLIEVLKGL